MRKQREKVSIKAAALLLGAALLTGGCSGYQSSEELRKGAENVQAETVNGSGNGAEGVSGSENAPDNSAVGENGEASGENASGPTAQIIQSETARTAAPAPEFKEVSDTVYVKSEGGSVRVRSSCDTSVDDNIIANVGNATKLKRTGTSQKWDRVEYEGMTVYISSDFVTTEVPKEPETTAAAANVSANGQVTLNSSWKYADYAKIKSGAAVLYRTTASEKKNKVIAVNAGHGTKGGTSVKTQCHPDGTPKVTGGTTGAGATSAVAVSTGMTFSDGTPESKVTLAMAKVFKDKLLAAGYDVLMIRDGDDVQLDNIARSVIANNAADCHIALHWDSTTSNKGAFYMSVPDVASYKNMEPVKSHWQQHNALGASLVSGLKGAGVKIFSGGSMAMDLTQTSYSTVPSIDIELGDKASDHSQATLNQLGDGLVAGVKAYFGQ